MGTGSGTVTHLGEGARHVIKQGDTGSTTQQGWNFSAGLFASLNDETSEILADRELANRIIRRGGSEAVVPAADALSQLADTEEH